MSGDAGNPEWAEVERVLGVVLDLSDGQQEAYLARQPAQIRAEVESLLAAHDRAGSFLGTDTGAQAQGTDTAKVFGMQAGTQLGPYRIETVIGEGGMGVVYRALDTKLNRPVAVKVLFDDLANAAARRRFQREAQMASSLNHPHILTVYDAGDFEGRQYLVTELVEGGTLRDWGRAQKRSWREIVALLSGVADGLATAHTAGILHRDIKPGNILVGRNGYAKLADFGLAKVESRSSSEALTRTLQAETTLPGMILGTIAYMSPEQASGRPTDARSDIFSFGVVLYELVAGRRPFEGATDLEVLQTIIHGTAPPLSANVPLTLRIVVEKALEKDPAERYQSTRDLAVDLRRLTRQSGEAMGLATTLPAAALATPAKHYWKAVALAALGLVALLLAGGGLLFWWQRPAPEPPRHALQFDISPPPDTIFAPPVMRQPFAISPDGTRLALAATGPNGTNIWVRDLASLDMRTVPGTEGAESLFWSPDGRAISYSVKRTLKQADLETGSGRTIAELPTGPQLGMWRAKGSLLLYLGRFNNFYEVLVESGTVRETAVGKSMRWPQFLPGEHFLYVAEDRATQHFRAMTSDYNGSKPAPLMETDSRVDYAPPRRSGESAYLLFIRGESLLAQPFDPERFRLAGEPFPIARNVIYYGATLSSSFSVSSNGVLVYQADYPITELRWYDRSGHMVGAAGRPAANWGTLRISSDGRRVAAAVWSAKNGGTDLWIFAANGRESRRLTSPPEAYRRPVWSPDGKRLAVGRSAMFGSPELATLDPDGNGQAQWFENSSQNDRDQGRHPHAFPTDWSHDSRFIAFDTGIPEEIPEVWVADVAANKIMPLLQNKSSQWGTAFSHDVKRIAFVSIDSGRPEVYVQAFESTPSPHVVGERRQVSTDGGSVVRWRADDRELFYLGTDNSLYAVPVEGLLKFGPPKPLFHVPGAPQYNTTSDFQFDVSQNGQRFLMTTTGSTPPPPFTVIVNWQDKFRR